jgi:polar amino acid transport system permease protein
MINVAVLGYGTVGSGVVEVIKVAQQIIEANRTASPNAAFGIYLTVFVLYFFVCWPISLLASYLEKKWK